MVLSVNGRKDGLAETVGKGVGASVGCLEMVGDGVIWSKIRTKPTAVTFKSSVSISFKTPVRLSFV